MRRTTRYTATRIIPPYISSTIFHHQVNSSFTSHATHRVHKPHSRVFPTTARTRYTFTNLIRAYLTLALLHGTEETIFPDDYAFSLVYV